MKIGIESIHFHVPSYAYDLRDLASKRDVDFAKYKRGIGQEVMAVPAPDEDVITLGANAARGALEGVERDSIRTVIFATESGIDQSKAGAIYIHHLLNLPANCRTVEMKQACCSSTSALHFALSTVALHPEQKVLIVAADIARYGLESAGEPTQGAGAVAMVVSANPRILQVDPEAGYYTEDVMDFWRPNYREEALVDGKYSIKVYMHALEQSWKNYQAETGASFSDFDHFCYHLPFSRMGVKAHLHLARTEQASLSSRELQAQIEPSLSYNRITGNCYTASLYLGLLSLLDDDSENREGRRVGFFSYGSGCMGAFFAGTIQPGYQQFLQTEARRELLAGRTFLSHEQYEDFYRFALPEDGSEIRIATHKTGAFRLAGMKDHQRQYETVSEVPGVSGGSSYAYAASPVMG